MNDQNIIEMKNIVKVYPGVIALKDVSIKVKKGEVHAIVGENGAGKSTLIKILTGSVSKDSGAIYFDGRKYDNLTPSKAIELGISAIYQEFNLVPQLTVEENIFLGKEIKKGLFANRRIMQKKTKEVLKNLDANINPNAVVNSLSVAYQQLVETAKAVLNEAKLIIMDEPSASLTNKELESLFILIKKLKTIGTSVIYISHRLEEIFEIADVVTVLRDGENIATENVNDTNRNSLIKLMVGRELSNIYPQYDCTSNHEVLEIKNLYTRKVKNINLCLKKGEIFGISGLVGAGRTELAMAIFGLDKYTGEIYVNGSLTQINSPKDAIKYKIGLIPEDRKSQGLVLNQPVKDNITYSILDSISKASFINGKIEKAIVNKYVKAISIKTPSIEQIVKNLSGGNQQKVVLAKWLAKQSDILIFDEPTRGIDVGAKQEIYNLMVELIREGRSIIMISSDLPELLGMSHRVAVMYDGEIVNVIAKEEVNAEIILDFACGLGGVK